MQLLNPNRDLDFSVRDVNIDFFKSLFDQRFRIMASNGYRKNSSTNDSAEKLGFVSLLLFQWMNDVMKTGNKRAPEEGDFVPLSKENT